MESRVEKHHSGFGRRNIRRQFTPLSLVASASALVLSPYREAHTCLAEPVFKEVDNGFDVIVHEVELCLSLLDKVKADVVHLGTSGGVPVE